MSSFAVRVDEESYKVIRGLAEARNESLQRTLADAIETYRRIQFLDAANQAFGKLRENETAWKHEVAERALWSNVEADLE